MSNGSQSVAALGDPIDYELVFASDPHPTLLVGIDDRFVILAASAKYLELHHTSRPNLVGKSLLEWLGAAGEDSQLRASLVHARETRSIHEMAVGADGHRIVHRPICGPDAEVRYLVHRVEVPGRIAGGAELDAIFRQAPVAIAILRGADNIVELANPMALQMWGMSGPAEIVGRPIFEAVPQGQNQGFEELLRQVRASGKPHVGREVPVSFYRDETGRGELHYLDFVYQPLEASGAGRDVVVCIAADVTETVLLRQKLGIEAADGMRATEQRLRQLVGAGFVGTWAMDAAGQIFADPLVATLFDLEPGPSHPLEQFFERIDPADRDRVRARIAGALRGANGGFFEAEYRLLPRADGSVRWVQGHGKADLDGDGNLRRFVGIVADITERKEGELERERLLAEVAHARRRLQSQLMQAPVGVSVVSGPELVFQLANDRYLAMTGRRDVVGKTMREAFPEIPADAPIFALLERAYRTGQPVSADEYQLLLDRTGTGVLDDIYFQFTTQPLREAGEEVGELFTVAIDVTVQVKSRQRIESLMRELEGANQRKDEFLATLAHELRNPMAAISTALSLLERSEDEPARTLKYRETARRQINNLVRLVDDLLDVARVTRGAVDLKKEEIDLSVVLQNAVAATRPLLESRGHELTVGIAPGSYRMIADGTRLEQVVTNLLTNAARYTDGGGRVAVHLAVEELAHAVEPDGEPAVERVAVLRVRDTGRGIPADMLERIFDMFTQVSPSIDRQNGGLGLGLTLVKRLVEMHGGRVVARSEGPGRGSELLVRLPMPALPVPAIQRAGSSPGFRKRRVLVVEDSEDVRETLKEFLESLGHEVFVAEDGVRGAARLLELSPDVALVDVGLPGIDGYEVARRVRKAETGRKHLMVALTGYGGPEVRARAEEAGFDLHVTKPVNLDWLTTFLNKANRS